jgi:hypothetical protein
MFNFFYSCFTAPAHGSPFACCLVHRRDVDCTQLLQPDIRLYSEEEKAYKKKTQMPPHHLTQSLSHFLESTAGNKL